MSLSLSRRTLLAAIALGAVAARASEDGVGGGRIVFGQPVPLDGPASALGIGMRDGIAAAFAEVNATGGVKGLKLELLSRDDGYDPNKSIDAAKKLLDEDKVFALIGSVGTPTAAAVQPIAAERGVPFIGSFTGAEFLRDPKNSNVINLRASYFQETEELVERLTKDLAITKIGIFYQDDTYGRAGLAGVQKALAKRSMAMAGEGTYERNTVAVKGGLVAIRKAAPEAVIMIGAYKPCAAFIQLAKSVKFAPIFLNVSFVGSQALANELGVSGAGTIVTQVVPLPTDTSIPVVARYQAALKLSAPDAVPGFVSMEGYLVGRLTIMALERLSGTPTRSGFLDLFHQPQTFDLGGVTLRYGPDRNFGSDTVFVTELDAEGRFRTLKMLVRTGS